MKFSLSNTIKSSFIYFNVECFLLVFFTFSVDLTLLFEFFISHVSGDRDHGKRLLAVSNRLEVTKIVANGYYKSMVTAGSYPLT